MTRLHSAQSLTHHDARVGRHGFLHGLGLDLLIEQTLLLKKPCRGRFAQHMHTNIMHVMGRIPVAQYFDCPQRDPHRSHKVLLAHLKGAFGDETPELPQPL